MASKLTAFNLSNLNLNLNTATADDLLLLPGVGVALARTIIMDREIVGPFGSVADLGRVAGVGPKKLAAIEAALSTTHQTSAVAALPATLPEKRLAVAEVTISEPITLPSNVLPFRAPTPAAAPKAPPNLFADNRLDVIKSPDGWEWTAGQIEAIRAIREHLRTQRGKPFVLKGYAGTGKTTLLVEALRPFAPPLMLAPTHKARSILEPKADKLRGRTMTVSGWLGYMPRVNPETGEDEFTRQKLSASMERKRYDPNVPIIVDEVSMVDSTRWAEILEIVQTYRLQFIAMGDPLQLPPIGEEISPAFEVDSGVELTEVMRSQGALTAAVLGVRERINQVVAPMVRYPYKDEVSEIEVINDRDRVVSRYIDALKKGEDAMILAYTNKVVRWCNKEVRKRIAGNDTRPYVPGELLVLTQPYTLEIPSFDDNGDQISTTTTLYTETRVIVESVEPAVHPHWQDKCWKLSIRKLGYTASASSVIDRYNDGGADDADLDGDEPYGPVYAYDEGQSIPILKKLTAMQNELKRLHKAGMKHDAELKAHEINGYKKSFLHARPAYATTVHKSQGSTWQTAFVLQGDIAKNQDVFERNRLLYVAYSRASKRLAVYGQ